MKNRMIRLATLVGLAGSGLLLQGTAAYAACPSPTGESYNPYLIQGIVSPAPLLPVEFNGTGTLQFDVGNTGSTEICVVSGEETTLVITLSKGVPDNVDPIAAVGGPGKAWFDWAYNADATTYTAKQIAPIPPGGRATITIAYKLTKNSFLAAAPTISNGLNINLQPPAFTNGPNATDDDNVSSYTYVSAADNGDAPASYITAAHTVDVTKDLDTGAYNRYMYLGTAVDPETTFQSSLDAKGDDNNRTGGLSTNDESGVTWPTSLPKGQTTNVPVVVTIWDWDPDNAPTGVQLRGWIDWNGGGTFGVSDSERVVNLNVNDYLVGEGVTAWTGPQSFTIPVPISVLAGQADGFYYARFRFGPSVAPTSPTTPAAYGEVEDYVIRVGNPTAVTMGDVDLIATGVPDFLRDMGANDLDAAGLLGLLRSWDPIAAAKLQGAGREALLTALRDYLDPDGDGQVVVFRWETLEERGTVGFYAERSQDGVWSRINGEMLPGLIAAPMGAQYWQADPGAQVGDDNQYRLIEVEARGRTNEYGPFDLRATPR